MLRLLRRTREEKGIEDPYTDLSGRLVTVLRPSAAASESYRVLRANLFYSVSDISPRVIAITSPNPREGKSTTCANLAVVLAQAGKRTLLVDGDLRKPEVHKLFGLRNVYGLMNVLTGEQDLQAACHEPLKYLKVLTVGPIPLNPAEVLSSQLFADFLDQARQQFDYVLVDTPPVQTLSDPAIVASLADGTFLVVDARKTRKRSVRQAMDRLGAVGASVIGTVFNNAKGSGGKNYAEPNYYGQD